MLRKFNISQKLTSKSGQSGLRARAFIKTNDSPEVFDQHDVQACAASRDGEVLAVAGDGEAGDQVRCEKSVSDVRWNAEKQPKRKRTVALGALIAHPGTSINPQL